MAITETDNDDYNNDDYNNDVNINSNIISLGLCLILIWGASSDILIEVSCGFSPSLHETTSVRT
jgi:hypothetical protein